MASMNYRILEKIKQEIEQENAVAANANPNEMVTINGYHVRNKNKDKFNILFDLKDILMKANNQGKNLYMFGEIGVCKEDYFSFMRLLHDPQNDIPIPQNLYVYGIIPGYNFPAPPIAPDNMDIKDVELEYQLFYAKHGIVAEYENGIRKPYPHEMYDWDKDGAIDSSYGKAHNYYYEKRYLVAKQQELANSQANTQTSTNENKQNEAITENQPKQKKRFRIFKRRQATEEEKEKMAESVDKSKDSPLEKKKRLKITLIICACAAVLVAIAFTAGVVLPAMFSNPAMFGTLLAQAPGFVLQNLGNLILHVGLPATAAALLIRHALKKCKKEQLTEDEKNEEKDNDHDEALDPNILMEQLKQRIIENEQKLGQKDIEIESAKNYTVPTDKTMAAKAEKDALEKIKKLQDEREELLKMRHQILNEMASQTVMPGGNGGMKR